MYTCQYVDLNDYIIDILVFISRLYAYFCAYQCLYTIYPVLHFDGKGQCRYREGGTLWSMLGKPTACTHIKTRKGEILQKGG